MAKIGLFCHSINSGLIALTWRHGGKLTPSCSSLVANDYLVCSQLAEPEGVFTLLPPNSTCTVKLMDNSPVISIKFIISCDVHPLFSFNWPFGGSLAFTINYLLHCAKTDWFIITSWDIWSMQTSRLEPQWNVDLADWLFPMVISPFLMEIWKCYSQ